MSSNIPVRRTTKTVTKTIKDPENANARPTRATTRARAALGMPSTSVLSDIPTTRSAATTASSRAKAVDAASEKTTVGKRKREILAEVTEVNKGKGKMAAKGKEKVEGSSSKPEARTRTTTTTVVAKVTRSALRKATGASTSTRSTQKDRAPSNPREGSVAPHEGVPATASSLSTGLPVFHLIPKDENETAAPLQAIPEDDSERPRVFKKRHTEPEEKPPVEAVDSAVTIDSTRYEEEFVATELAVTEEEEGQETWDDLDTEDIDDPLMVAEYIHEITAYLKEREIRTLPMENYMDHHRELDWNARQLVLDWISSIHARYNFIPESYFLFVNTFDRFLSLRPSVTLKKLQLVAISTFCVAVKYEEGISPALSELVTLTEDSYTIEEIGKAERFVLKTINYDLSFPGPMTWLRRGSKADGLESRARTIAKYLLEVGSFEQSLVAVPPSLMAAVTLWFARLMLEREDWGPTLVHYAGYTEQEIIPVANRLLKYLLQPMRSAALYKKYASKRHLKCSVYVERWLAHYFPHEEVIDLGALLPAIKAEIREQRASRPAGEEA